MPWGHPMRACARRAGRSLQDLGGGGGRGAPLPNRWRSRRTRRGGRPIRRRGSATGAARSAARWAARPPGRPAAPRGRPPRQARPGQKRAVALTGVRTRASSYMDRPARGLRPEFPAARAATCQNRRMHSDASLRAGDIRVVLLRVLALNLLVAGAKLIYGIATGAISMVADGIHSAMDSSSNVIGLIGTAVAARPPDPGHPYGHRKFEVIAALGITFLLFLACYEILTGAVERLMSGSPPEVTGWSFAIMIGTIVINLF